MKMASKHVNCCKIETFFGYSLTRGIMFVGIAALVISFVTMLTGLGIAISLSGEDRYNNKPVQAVDLIFSLFSSSVSAYQFVISILLVTRKFEYASTLWYISHISILALYGFMFSTRTVVYFHAGQYLGGAFTVAAAVVYTSVFIFFMIVVNSYILHRVTLSTQNFNLPNECL